MHTTQVRQILVIFCYLVLDFFSASVQLKSMVLQLSGCKWKWRFKIGHAESNHGKYSIYRTKIYAWSASAWVIQNLRFYPGLHNSNAIDQCQMLRMVRLLSCATAGHPRFQTEAPRRQTTIAYEFLIWQMAMIIIRKTAKMVVVCVLRDYDDICNQI